MPNQLVVSVLGEVSASHDGVPLDLGGRRQRAVLGMLVLARGDTVPADTLIDALWGERPPPAAVAALQSYVSHLRRGLEPGRDARSRASVIASQGRGYALLLRGDAVDAWHFERLVRDAAGDPSADGLQQALDLWRGPAYAEYADEPWAQAEIARLAELREVAREQLAAARLARGEAAVTVAELESLVAAAPLREERWRLLILALYRSHRQADALAALRRARQLLADELGIDPGPALRALEAEVHAQAESLNVQATDAVVTQQNKSGQATEAVVAQQKTSSDDLVDRDRELADLDLALADALRGDARLLLVEGPAGIGKTRLLTEARRRGSARGAQVFTARGSRLEKEYGFGAIRQLFEAAAATPGMLDGPAASAATVFDVAGTAQREDSGLAVMHGLYRLTVNLAAAAPLVLAVDDLQWCDSGSLRFLAYLVRRVEGLPVLIVATLRTGEPHDDAAILEELTADPITVPVRPGPLSAQGAASVVRSRLGAAADSFVDACHRSTTGNPLLLRQLLQALHSERVPPDAAHAGTVTAIGSRAVSGLVLMRLGRLSPACVAVAKAIAVLGNGAALPTVAVLADVPEDEAAVAVATLARAEVLRDEYPLGFVHPLVADAVYSDLAPGQRQLRHDRAARVLAAAGAAPEQVAAHLSQVPPRGDAWVVG
ncbi:BTAD domain-containing putative transcriptional regulator, partial [Dactylosporangium sp. NPDC049525]|uniref:BTAD domain-containing putative transcriptional regulator n=1 Tax=Dactylosporangium sp. NPDC049525 TaxID=3154730 RepID=UPI00342288CE